MTKPTPPTDRLAEIRGRLHTDASRTDFLDHAYADIAYLLQVAESAAALLEALRESPAVAFDNGLWAWYWNQDHPDDPKLAYPREEMYAALQRLSAALGTEAGG